MRTDLFSAKLWKRRIYFWLGALLVGIVAVLFAEVASLSDKVFHLLFAKSKFWPFLICPAGLILITYFTRNFFPYINGSGIPQTMAALQIKDEALRSAMLNVRVVVGKFFLTILGFLSGASIGREGPSVQIGGAIMHFLWRLGHFEEQYMERGLILAGAAAGISAAFNAPIAGIVFAIEELGRSFENTLSGTIITAVILAGIVAISFQGNYTYFGNSQATMQNTWQWFSIPICGVLGGLLGGAFSWCLVNFTAKTEPLLRKYPYWVVASCGLVIAAIGCYAGGITFGSGYEEAKVLMQSSEDFPTLTFTIGKWLATLVSYISGIPGGIFAPTLAVGVGVGQLFGNLLPFFSVKVLVVLGMVAYFSGVLQSPITCFVIVNEMISNHDMVIPVMATAVIACFASRLICPEPLYETLSKRFIPLAKLES